MLLHPKNNKDRLYAAHCGAAGCIYIYKYMRYQTSSGSAGTLKGHSAHTYKAVSTDKHIHRVITHQVVYLASHRLLCVGGAGDRGLA